MSFILQPWQIFFIILASWVNRQQHEIIAYLRCENQVLREKLGKKRILLNDDQRRRLAVKGKVLGRKLLEEIGTLFTPDTLLRWPRKGHREAAEPVPGATASPSIPQSMARASEKGKFFFLCRCSPRPKPVPGT